jgi:ACS family allantoate permease-like MFS transporter
LIITSLGFDTLTTLLMNLPGSAVSFVATIVLTGLASRVRRSRILLCICSWLIAILGLLLIRELPTSNKYGRLVGAWLMNAFATAFPLLLSLLARNVTGFTKKATVQAHFFIFYCAGNIAGPQLFISKEKPRYLVSFFLPYLCDIYPSIDSNIVLDRLQWLYRIALRSNCSGNHLEVLLGLGEQAPRQGAGCVY